MEYGSIRWRPWVCLLKDDEGITDVKRFDNFQDMLQWRLENIRKGLNAVSMTEEYYLGLETDEHAEWWKSVKQLIASL
jgi:hypothetical protein